MNRRGHLSTKVPQVKLRPAPAGPSSRIQREASPINKIDEEIMRRALADPEDEESSTAALRRNSKPWKGITITFTGVENKPALTVLAKELGAVVENALTIHVTHVVAVGHDSAKYLYAVEHRLPVMTPSWIEAAHSQWIHGDEVDTAADQEVHRLLPFSGLKIAMSGIEPLDRRKQLIKYINQYGGEYSKDLDRTCTHLISSKPTNEKRPSEKIKWALRELAELEAKRRKGIKTNDEDEMKIIYEEWIWDCVAYNGRWKEDWYDAKKPRRGGKVIPEDVINGRVNLPTEKKASADATAPGADAVDNNEPAVLRKRKRESMSTLVTELVSTTGVKPKRESSISKQSVSPHIANTTTSNNEPVKSDIDRKPSLLHVSRSTSFATNPVKNTCDSERTSSIPPTAQHPTETPKIEVKDEEGTNPAGSNEEPKKFFEGFKFSHVIEEQCDGLENAIRQHGGILVSDEKRRQGEKVDYIIVRLCSDIRPKLSDTDEGTIVVTECWVEGCCFEEVMLSPDKHIVFRPLPGNMPIPGSATLNVHLSGFSAENNVYMRRLLRAIGGTLSIKLNRQTSHLITVATTGQKVEKAREWGVKVMKESWLVAMGRSGQIEPEEEHALVAGPPAVAARAIGKTSDLTANLSILSDLPDNSDFALRPSSSSRPTSQVAPPISPSRILKPSPTHIDDPENNTSTSSLGILNGSRSNLHKMDTTTSIQNALSPPKPQTERLLNSAQPFSIPSRPVSTITKGETIDNSEDYEKEKDKLSRYASAPAQPESLSRQQNKNTKDSLGEKAASTSNLVIGAGAGGGGGGSMTEALRQLAEKDGSTPGKGRVVRRARPSARIKNTRSPLNSVSPAASKFSAPPSPRQDPDISYMGADGTPILDDDISSINGDNNGIGEESVQVRYVDANSAKERKKLMAMFGNGNDDESAERGSAKKSKRK
ncbi:uncharacterized protein L201_000226 [Kwoniella dendrophila CBS 6074]|uniref:BRCT domain-containing protein n=1 Tax=Kwoniella dendrophila CBS 6074 TaxID=1295534 RepID=A0AAX4JLT8_9TREE